MRIAASAFVAAAALFLAGGIASAAEPVRRVLGAATLEDIPPVPTDIHESVARYGFSRPAAVMDWLVDGSLLIGTRFGATQQLHRVAFPGGARTQVTFFAEPVNSAVAIPGTDRILFARDTGGDEWFQLYSQPTRGGPAVSYTEAGTQNAGPVFSRDGKRLFWTRATKGSGAYSVLTASLADPASRKVIHTSVGGLELGDVSPDGKRLLAVRVVSNRETHLLLIDAATGEANQLAAGPPTRFAAPHFTADGKGVFVLTDRGNDLMQLMRLDLASGILTRVSPPSKWEVEDFTMSRDASVMAYSYNEDGFFTVHLADGGGHPLPEPPLPKGVLGGLTFNETGTKLALTLSSATSPGDVWSYDLKTKKLERWTESEIGPIDRATLAQPYLIRFHSFDGLSVPAFVYRPVQAPARAKTPVLISIHGGPEAQSFPGWSATTQFYADTLGVTVIVPNVRGSTGYGRAYMDMDNGPKREDSVKDIGSLLDWIAKQPTLDAGRVAVIGGSYSGYVVLASMELYGDRLAAGVESFGITDWTSFLQHTEAYRRDNRRGEYGDERDPAMQAVFDRISPMKNVRKINKPMLIQQGVNDPRVPKSESDQMVAALRAQGVPVQYLVFADEGHGFRKKPNQDLSLEVSAAFLRRVLGGGEPVERPETKALQP